MSHTIHAIAAAAASLKINIAVNPLVLVDAPRRGFKPRLGCV